MNKPQRVALTAAIGAAAIPLAAALSVALQGPLNALLWQLSYLLPTRALELLLVLGNISAIACFAAVLGFAIARIWSRKT
jgi:hypothetical protein